MVIAAIAASGLAGLLFSKLEFWDALEWLTFSAFGYLLYLNYQQPWIHPWIEISLGTIAAMAILVAALLAVAAWKDRNTNPPRLNPPAQISSPQ